MSRLGVAVVGLGVGEAHARAYRTLPSCDLKWLYDIDATRSSAVARELGGEVATSYEAVVGDPAVDLISIASYDHAHASQVVAALDHGKHVFVEKPIATTLDELRAVKAAWQRSSRHLSSNLILRAAPLYVWLREAIASGELGEIYAIDGDYLYGRAHKITDGWRAGVDHYSVMEGGGIHLVDLMQWLTGQKPRRVAAVGNQIATRGSAFRYHDFMAATFEFPSGMVGRVTANFGCVHRHQHVLRVFGTRATFLYDDRGPRLHVSADPAETAAPIEKLALAASKGDLVPGFVAAILAGDRQAADTQRHFDVLSTCVAADRSAEAATFMEIEYV